MKIKTINQIASTKTLTDKYGICSDENGNTNSFALADIVEPINNLKNEVGKIKVNGSGIESISYPELVALRNENKLAPGQMYRIIDYVTTTTQDKTKSANHPFDIIVTALNENTLDEKASAIAHEEDTYFDGNDLSAWELWYDLDNDTDKYEWADSTNGKGVIYRMIDEKRNDCPYDFKNILFYNDKYTDYTTTDKYYFTFSYVVSGVLYDGTVEIQVKSCYSNSMGVYKFGKKILNKNVFRNKYFNNYCHSNTFGYDCYYNTFGYNCYSNTFGYYCYSNTFGYDYYSNTFGYYCYSNTFGYDCYSNTFGNYCYINTFGDNCDYNTLGNYCHHNTFGYNYDSNTFGNYCHSNTFGYNCYSNTFGNYCHSNTFGYNCYSNTFGNDYDSIHIDGSSTSITCNDEYYDDGSGKLVPIKHPDLSTQPSILPYKFMGQYVYEILLSIPDINLSKSTYTVDASTLLEYVKNLYAVTILQAEELLFCHKKGSDYPSIPMFVHRNISISTGEIYGGTAYYGLEIKPDKTYNETSSTGEVVKGYLRIVYTSMPEGSDYYGYNNY